LAALGIVEVEAWWQRGSARLPPVWPMRAGSGGPSRSCAGRVDRLCSAPGWPANPRPSGLYLILGIDRGLAQAEPVRVRW